MVLKREAALEIVSGGLSWLQYDCKNRGLMRLFDGHTVAHEFYRRFLNIIFDLRLDVLDLLRPNHPSIDLGDTDNKRSFQITAGNSLDKIQHTIDSFIKFDLAARYGKLQIVIIGEKKTKYDKLKNAEQIGFDSKTDIFDVKALIKLVESFKTEKILALAAVVKSEFRFDFWRDESDDAIISKLAPKAALPHSMDDLRLIHVDRSIWELRTSKGLSIDEPGQTHSIVEEIA